MRIGGGVSEPAGVHIVLDRPANILPGQKFLTGSRSRFADVGATSILHLTLPDSPPLSPLWLSRNAFELWRARQNPFQVVNLTFPHGRQFAEASLRHLVPFGPGFFEYIEQKIGNPAVRTSDWDKLDLF